jgi:plasmid stabilization system protein ParE
VTPALVRYDPKAQADLDEIFAYISARSSVTTANRFIAALRRSCELIGYAPTQGRRRDEVRRGLRVTGFRRRVDICFIVDEGVVVVLRLLYGGRDIAQALREHR